MVENETIEKIMFLFLFLIAIIDHELKGLLIGVFHF